ncbi:uncharacterized protein LOC135208344 [Macrobrachium nipponense]|uniref:uncharacterized protein LOC135208344 n=1 Tax=Macrobrachium nipponense TaxID=159736 RepID=UPI0030C8B7FB
MMKSSDLENGNSFVKKVDNKWDQFFSEVISQVMNKDENAEDRKEFQVKSRNVKKSHRFKGAVEKKNCWSNGTLRIDDKENVTSVSMKRCKSKRKPLKQVNMNKRLRSKKEAVASDQKLLSRSSSDSEASEHDDSPRTLAYKRELLHIVEKTYDSWVQCDTCSKWRKLPPNIDPASLPPKWFCELNYNENQNVCSAPEDDWNKEYVYVYNGYILGSVVWARVTGRDWWPAMVDIDPDFQIHNWLDDSAKNVWVNMWGYSSGWSMTRAMSGSAPSTCESPHADKAPFLEQGIPHDRQTANGIAGTNKKEEGKYVQPQSDSDVDGEERRALGKNCTIHIKEKYSCNAEYVPSQKYFVENTKDSQPEDSNKECRKTAEFFDSKQSQIDLCDDEKESEFKSCMTNMSPEVPSSEEMHDTINTIIRNLDMITSQDESLPSNGGKFLNNKNK